MTDRVLAMPGLRADAPIGVLAALGLLDVVHRRLPDLRPRLSWAGELQPRAHLHVADGLGLDELADIVAVDATEWIDSGALNPRRDGLVAHDVKLDPHATRQWAEDVAKDASSTDRAAADLHRGLVAEGAVAGDGRSKPTHLHFTAGNQQFLAVARSTGCQLVAATVVDAATGGEAATTNEPGLNWEAGGARLFAHSGGNPAKEKKPTHPGLNWLAFLGLSFLPVVERARQAHTTAALPTWKAGGALTWPVWYVPLSAPVVRSLVARQDLADLAPGTLSALGITQVRRSPITRSDQGGYGAFGPSGVIASADTRPA